MSRFEFKLPDIGEGVTEGEVVTWLVHPGDVVAEDQPMVEVMTDKATVTIACPRAGRVVETRGKPGEMVLVHSVLVVLELDATSNANANGGAPKPDEGPAATAVGDIKEHLPGMGRAPAPAIPAVSPEASGYWSEKPLATPATRKHARDRGIDLRAVPPSGDKGRVLSRDVDSFLQQQTPITRVPITDLLPGAPHVHSATNGQPAPAARARGDEGEADYAYGVR